MKNTIITLLLLISFLSCKAQTYPLSNPPDDFDTNNAYYKDTNNDLTKLVGTWQYTNGSQTFKIILKKKTHLYSDLSERNLIIYQDFIYGEYKYVNPNAETIVNTLSNIDLYSDVSQHLVFGNFIKDNTYLPECNDCSASERRVQVMIIDPERSYFDYDMIIRHVAGDLFGTPEQIKVTIRRSDMAFAPNGEPLDNRLPLKIEFVLTKL